MKRIGNLYSKICSLDNLYLADEKASKGKSRQFGVIQHKRNQEDNLLSLRDSLLNKTYRTSRYSVFTIREPKERKIHRLPYFPDRIVHHAILNVLEPILVKTFTADTYSCIKGRGCHKASYKLRRAVVENKYCLKFDIRKFYETIDHEILKEKLRRKIKDKESIWLLDEIVDSTEGLPIGNYLSQWFANVYLNSFDHWLKEEKHVKHYYRYCDDCVILGDDKHELRELFREIVMYLNGLKLSVKTNHQIFPIEKRGIDFVGYRHYPTHVLLRKSIKKRFIKMIQTRPNYKSMMAYNGWTSHANCKNLTKKWTIETI